MIMSTSLHPEAQFITAAQTRCLKIALQLVFKTIMAQRISEYQLEDSHNDNQCHRNQLGLLMHTITGTDSLITLKYALPTDSV